MMRQTFDSDGRLVEAFTDNGDGTGTRTTYNADGTSTFDQEVTGPVEGMPLVVRIVGTNAAEAAVLLREGGFETAASLDEAAEKAVALAAAGGGK